MFTKFITTKEVKQTKIMDFQNDCNHREFYTHNHLKFFSRELYLKLAAQ
jgi:hypothetical protein